MLFFPRPFKKAALEITSDKKTICCHNTALNTVDDECTFSLDPQTSPQLMLVLIWKYCILQYCCAIIAIENKFLLE